MLAIARKLLLMDVPRLMRGNGLFPFSLWQTQDWSGGGGGMLMCHEMSLMSQNYPTV